MTLGTSPVPIQLQTRLAAPLLKVMRYVTRRVQPIPPSWQGVQIPAAMERLINGWIAHQLRLIVAIIARIAAGTQRAPRPYRPRPGAPETKLGRAAPALRVPTLFAWLVVLAQEVHVEGRWLAHLLNEAELKEMVLAHPQLARRLRPLLRMLGQRPPGWMPPPPKRAQHRRRNRAAREGSPGMAPCPASSCPASSPSAELAQLVAEAVEQQRRRHALAAPAPPPALGVGRAASASPAEKANETALLVGRLLRR